mgnify:CR=1 FL=1
MGELPDNLAVEVRNKVFTQTITVKGFVAHQRRRSRAQRLSVIMHVNALAEPSLGGCLRERVENQNPLRVHLVVFLSRIGITLSRNRRY